MIWRLTLAGEDTTVTFSHYLSLFPVPRVVKWHVWTVHQSERAAGGKSRCTIFAVNRFSLLSLDICHPVCFFFLSYESSNDIHPEKTHSIFFPVECIKYIFLGVCFHSRNSRTGSLAFSGRREKKQNARTQILRAKPHFAFSDLSQTFKDISRWKNIQFCGRVAGRNKNKAASL